MRTAFKLLVMLALALGALGSSTPAVFAAVPTNDALINATTVSIGFSEVLDTTEATTDADDAQMNINCGAPATDASVWYKIDGNDTNLVVDVSQSNYSAGVIVAAGGEGDLAEITCGHGTVSFFAYAGTTYYVLAIDDQLDGNGNGGLLDISFNEMPPAPTAKITFNRFGRVDPRTGVVTISGKYTCSDGDYIDMRLDAKQQVGRFTLNGFGAFFDSGTCDGTTRNWSVNVIPQNGKFSGGKAMSLTYTESCGPFECSSGYDQSIVQLRGGGTK